MTLATIAIWPQPLDPLDSTVLSALVAALPLILILSSICMRFMEGAEIYQIAKNCRTCVEMIGKYYAAHIKTMLGAAAINVMRPTKMIADIVQAIEAAQAAIGVCA
ncbi:MAG: hypothetical protein WCB11_03015 [Terriglobales bacterium]